MKASSEEFVRSVYPRIYYTRELVNSTNYHVIYATRTGHHASTITFCVQAETEEEMWDRGQTRIIEMVMKDLVK